MKLENKYKDSKYSVMKEYHCEISRFLDEQVGLKEDGVWRLWKHYILADDWCLQNQCLAIRIPGGTVGGIWIDENNVITKIHVDTDYVVKTYPDNINELLRKFVGEKIEIGE